MPALSCPSCRQSFAVSRDEVGGAVACPHCQQRLTLQRRKRRDWRTQPPPMARPAPIEEVDPFTRLAEPTAPAPSVYVEAPQPAPPRSSLAQGLGWGFGLTCGYIAAIGFVCLTMIAGCIGCSALVLTGGAAANKINQATLPAEQQEFLRFVEEHQAVEVTILKWEGAYHGGRNNDGPLSRMVEFRGRIRPRDPTVARTYTARLEYDGKNQLKEVAVWEGPLDWPFARGTCLFYWR